jgi:hypothetical protein
MFLSSPGTCHMPWPLHHPSFDYLNAVWWVAQITKLHIARLQAENRTEGLPNKVSCWRDFVFVLLVSSGLTLWRLTTYKGSEPFKN